MGGGFHIPVIEEKFKTGEPTMAISTGDKNLQFLTQAIHDTVKHEINTIFAEEFKEATARAEKRIRAELDKIALSVLSEYYVERMGPNILIRVVKGNEK